MRILFVTQNDPFHIPFFFSELFKERPNYLEIVGVIVCPPMGKHSIFSLAKQMFMFYGFLPFVRVGIRYVLSLFSRPLVRLCRSHGVRVYFERSINEKPFLSFWESQHLDLIVSVAAPVIFKKELIGLPKHGCINIHHGALPFYRGMMPTFWQLFHGEKRVGITVHQINERLDEGPIILQEFLTVSEKESLESLIIRSKQAGAGCLLEAIRRINDGTVQYKENVATEGSYFSFPTRVQVHEFKRRGGRLI